MNKLKQVATKEKSRIFGRSQNKLQMDWGNRVPRQGAQDYTPGAVRARVKWLEETVKTKFKIIHQITEPTESFKGNIENLIGTAQIPIGIAGPLRVNGDHAKGEFYVPLATTEGVLVNSFHRGARIITKSGGANVKIQKKEMHVSPVFKLENLKQINQFLVWLEKHFREIQEETEKTTRFGKLLKITPKIVGNKVILKMSYDTRDAMGMNMITLASDRAAHFIAKNCGISIFYPRSNYSSDKKPSSHLYIECYGRSVHAEAVIPAELIRYFGATAEKMFEYYLFQTEASIAAGMLGVNGQFANGITAVFLATGQDAAQIINSAVGQSVCEPSKNGDLFISVNLPNLLIGTVGGGTRRGYARECLQILDCYGAGKSDKFAEIVAGLVLAGELSILGAMAGGTFVDAHRIYGRPK